jgi:hypothetical protein
MADNPVIDKKANAQQYNNAALPDQISQMEQHLEQRHNLNIGVVKFPVSAQDPLLRKVLSSQMGADGEALSTREIEEIATRIVLKAKASHTSHRIMDSGIPEGVCLIADKREMMSRLFSSEAVQQITGGLSQEEIKLLSSNFVVGHELVHCKYDGPEDVRSALERLEIPEKKDGLIGNWLGSNEVHNAVVKDYGVYLLESTADTMNAIHLRKYALDHGGEAALKEVDITLQKMVKLRDHMDIKHDTSESLSAAIAIPSDELRKITSANLERTALKTVDDNALQFSKFKKAFIRDIEKRVEKIMAE